MEDQVFEVNFLHPDAKNRVLQEQLIESFLENWIPYILKIMVGLVVISFFGVVVQQIESTQKMRIRLRNDIIGVIDENDQGESQRYRP